MKRETWTALLTGPAEPGDHAIFDGRPKVGDDGLLARLIEAHQRPRYDYAPELVAAERRARETSRAVVPGPRICANETCRKPITRESPHSPLTYCCSPCRLAAKHRRYRARHKAAGLRYAQSRRDRLRAQAEPRTCELCGQAFRPLDLKGRQRFCGLVCRSRNASAAAAATWTPARMKRNARGRFVERDSC